MPGIIPFIVEHDLPEGGKEFTLAPQGFHESFCADVSADDAAFCAISQRPLAGVALSEAAMRVRHLANQVADKKLEAAAAVETLLPDEPGMHLARAAGKDETGDVETGASTTADGEETATPVTPGEEVPVEDLPAEPVEDDNRA